MKRSTETKLRRLVERIIREEVGTYPQDMSSQHDKDTWDRMQDDKERELWWELTKQWRKNSSFGKFNRGTPAWLKDSIKKLERDLEKHRRNREKGKLDITSVKKIFQENGLRSVKYTGTRIRGYSIPSSNSYEISKDDPSKIEFHGITQDSFEAIITHLETSGFKVSNKSGMSKTHGGPNHGSIKISK